ncbi:MAG TPA: arsenate reductase (glutaredoxin) [Flavobacteriales bacterium]|nr:arsenate reductase (glutaredoxin) [Flavobacteriales bacterium]
MKIYHNPRCSKSRQALALIQEKGQEVEIIEYLKESLSFKDLKSILEMLNIKAIELIRTNEIIWKENYKAKEMTDQELINAMMENPKLIERPIVIKNGKAIIGRPPEKVLDLLL